MKVKISTIVLVTLLATAVGYLMGTNDGRQRRDAVVARVRRSSTSVSDSTETEEPAGAIVEQTTDAG